MSKILIFLLFLVSALSQTTDLFKPETHCARETMYTYGGCTDTASFYENGGLCEEYNIKLLNDLTPEEYYNQCVSKQKDLLAKSKEN